MLPDALPMAAVYEEGRRRLPAEEAERILRYLEGCETPVSAPGVLKPDAMDPAGREVVPEAFHTDGVWVWRSDVPYYLRTHGLPPDTALVDHIRSRAYVPPITITDRQRDCAVATVLGLGRPPGISDAEWAKTLAPSLRTDWSRTGPSRFSMQRLWGGSTPSGSQDRDM